MTMPTISEAGIEAAARAMQERHNVQHRRPHYEAWDVIHDSARQYWRDKAKSTCVVCGYDMRHYRSGGFPICSGGCQKVHDRQEAEAVAGLEAFERP